MKVFFFFLCFKIRNLKMNLFSSKAKKGKIPTRQDQEITSGPITDRMESLTIPNRQIQVDSPTCLKTLLKKTQEMF
jgi:hypothetical protein